MTRPGLLLIATIIAAPALGCGPGDERPVSAAGGVRAPFPAGAHPWRVTAFGAGPIRAGMTIAEAAAVSPDQLAVKDTWGECAYVKPTGGPEGLSLMIVDGEVARVDITMRDVPTAEGVRVGDSEARVRDVYGEANVAASPHKYTDGHYLTVAAEAGHRLVFETDGARVTRYRGGRLPEVGWVEGCG